MKKKSNFDSLKDKWPSSFVAREKISEFTGGIIHPRSIANLDALGKGPKGRIRIGGKKIAYPVDSVLDWLEERSEILDPDD